MSSNDVHPTLGGAKVSDPYCLYDDARNIFVEEKLQYLDRINVVRCQEFLGHGDQFGVWETPESLIGRQLTRRDAVLLLRERLIRYLPLDLPRTANLEILLDEGVLVMTRYALLMRMGPSTFHKRYGNSSLDPTTILGQLQIDLPLILAAGIKRKLEEHSSDVLGLVRCLSPEDLKKLNLHERCRLTLKRMAMLASKGLWNETPVIADTGKTTNPKGGAMSRSSEEKSNPFLPIPNEYLTEMGPRILWIVQDLGPNLIALAEALPELIDMKLKGRKFRLILRRYFDQNIWRDREGLPILQPPFRFQIGGRTGAHSISRGRVSHKDEWPPRTWQHILTLMVTLQSAHLWIALLAMAGRVQEILTLKRECVQLTRSGDENIVGKTYKLSKVLAGEVRDWPAPEILVQALAQQVQLVSACESVELLRERNDDCSVTPQVKADHLWASLGTGPWADSEKQLMDVNHALKKLAKRLDMAPDPGGANLHTHRFRKTIARLAALAIVDSPRVLMQLFGHRDIAMTLHYILTDKALQVEIEQVAQELRIMRCQEVIEDIHTSLHNSGLPFGGHGGGAAPNIVESIKTQEEILHRQGRLWNADAAYELAVILTNKGQYFRVVKPGVLCTKPSRQASPCNCGSDCENRIEEKTARRDVQAIVPILINQGQLALEENRLLLVANIVEQLEEELERFDDIAAAWSANPELISLREAVKS
ncbi:tyrosine-type recombinase/integrase [Pseudomonas sp. NPDC086251]|uniref:tyrosine-type recombinase/integrase n=1 Tax=Pseudomonas sp. NPDC086251 TaxID=3364431 RepID=UPI003836EC6E